LTGHRREDVTRDHLFNAIVVFGEAFGRGAYDERVARRIRPLERVTRWEMPTDDPSIGELVQEDRRQMADVWAGRCDAEVRSVPAFALIAESLMLMDAPVAVVSLAQRAVDDERRHIEICRRTASAYQRTELRPPPAASLHPPVYAGADRIQLALLRVIAQCCLNETTACAFARLCLSIATVPIARAPLREIIADEIDHARVGWAALASAPPALRTSIAPWLPDLITTHLDAWSIAAIESSPALRVHGIPSRTAALLVVREVMDDVILPGFAELGVPLRLRAGE
jgi:hypothetical protein